MAINPDFAGGGAYVFDPLKPIDIDKGVAALQNAQLMAERKKEKDVALKLAEDKLKAENQKEANKTLNKNLSDAQLQFQVEVGGLHPKIIPKIQERQAQLGIKASEILNKGGDLTDWTNPEVAQWHQDILGFKNSVGNHKAYYADVIKSVQSGKELLQQGKQLQGYDGVLFNKTYTDYIDANGLLSDPDHPYVTPAFTEKKPLKTAAELAEEDRKEIELAKNTTMADKSKYLGNWNYETQTTNTTTANVNPIRKRIMGYQYKKTNGQKLTPEEDRDLESRLALADAMGFAKDGVIQDEYWQDLANTHSKIETVEGQRTQTPWTPPKVSDNNDNNNSFGWNGNTMILGSGKKKNTIAFNPNGADIRIGNIVELAGSPEDTPQEGDFYYQSVGSTAVDGGALSGDKMLENSAWAIGKGTKAQPFIGDVGTINTDQLLILPTSKNGEPVTAIRGSKKYGNTPRTGFERYNLFAKVITPKVGDAGGETVLVNLHNAFPAEMEKRGMRTQFNDEEAKRWTGESQTEQPQTPVQQPQGKKRDGKFNGAKIPGVN